MPSSNFRPSLEQLETRTLLSVGQPAGLGGPKTLIEAPLAVPLAQPAIARSAVLNQSATVNVARAAAPNAVALDVAAKALNVLRALDDPVRTNGLPFNEGTLAQLRALQFPAGAKFFVPAQAGTWFAASILSNSLRAARPTFTAGLTRLDLLVRLRKAVGRLENIMAFHAFVDPQTGGKALYQVHRSITGVAPRGTDFERTVSLLDNATLVAALQATAAHMRPFAPVLAARIDAILRQFNLRMWWDGAQLHKGAPDDPRAGGPIDRIVTEGRLAVVAARARGELSQAEFRGVIDGMLASSKMGATPGGVQVQQLPFFGTALEIASVTPYLSSELSTFFGAFTLHPLVNAWEEARRRLGLPAVGATGVADGFGGFRLFGLTPTEGSPQHLDARVTNPPAAGMMAGAIRSPLALQNLSNTVSALSRVGKYDFVFGAPNYLDFGTGLVNSRNPMYGFLEIGQMAVALLNHLSGGLRLEGLLRADAGWANALNEYALLLQVREAEFTPGGNGGPKIPRTNASGGQVWHLESVGHVAEYSLPISFPGAYNLQVRYSNDDTGVGDDVAVLVNGAVVGAFHTQDTGDGGNGWDNFVTSPAISLGNLPAGAVTLALRLDATDGFGVDLDMVRLV